MTGWDHDPGHDADHDPGTQEGPSPDWSAEPAHLGFGPVGEPDPYGDEPADPAASTPAGPPDEPAALPEEPQATWSDPHQPDDSVPWSDPDQGTVEWSSGLHDPAAVADPGDWIDGTDPAGWSDADVTLDPFPPALDLDVQPADGGPWVDPALLGGPDAFAGDPSGPDLISPADPPEALRSDLAAADGNPDAGWDALRDSDDPAVRALAAHWTP